MVKVSKKKFQFFLLQHTKITQFLTMSIEKKPWSFRGYGRINKTTYCFELWLNFKRGKGTDQACLRCISLLCLDPRSFVEVVLNNSVFYGLMFGAHCTINSYLHN